MLVFFDDILVYSKSGEEHLEHLLIVFQQLKAHQLYAKKSKCSFGQEIIGYLGHFISQEGVSTDPTKIENMKNLPTPKNIKMLSGFLGLTGYYRKFIKDYGLISRPLTQLLRTYVFIWTKEIERAFNCLMKVMTTTPILALHDFNKPFIIEANASGKGI